jgi:hypothetical protein
MSRDDGFPVMDVSTDIVNDPKVRKLYRHAPDHAGTGFVAYVGTLSESWKAGRRVTVDDAWPACVAFDKAAVEALIHVGLLDRTGRIPVKSWRGWFEAARVRREKSRERWRRYNEKRDADTAEVPRGNHVGTATSVPPVRPSVPPAPTGASVNARVRAPEDPVEKDMERRQRELDRASEEFKAGLLDEMSYQRRRKELLAI